MSYVKCKSMFKPSLCSDFLWIFVKSLWIMNLHQEHICHLSLFHLLYVIKWVNYNTRKHIHSLTISSHLPYLTCAISPTTMSATGSCMTWLPRTTWNFCSCSMRLCSPRNCFSFDQSLKAVTSTTHTTDKRIAAPSIQPASASPSSSTPPAAAPQATVR